jgi:hypothetical protein
MSVGTTALPITTVTRTVYWLWSMTLFVSPNSAEIDPNVSPLRLQPLNHLALRLRERVTKRKRPGHSNSNPK